MANSLRSCIQCGANTSEPVCSRCTKPWGALGYRPEPARLVGGRKAKEAAPKAGRRRRGRQEPEGRPAPAPAKMKEKP